MWRSVATTLLLLAATTNCSKACDDTSKNRSDGAVSADGNTSAGGDRSVTELHASCQKGNLDDCDLVVRALDATPNWSDGGLPKPAYAPSIARHGLRSLPDARRMYAEANSKLCPVRIKNAEPRACVEAAISHLPERPGLAERFLIPTCMLFGTELDRRQRECPAETRRSLPRVQDYVRSCRRGVPNGCKNLGEYFIVRNDMASGPGLSVGVEAFRRECALRGLSNEVLGSGPKERQDRYRAGVLAPLRRQRPAKLHERGFGICADLYWARTVKGRATREPDPVIAKKVSFDFDVRTEGVDLGKSIATVKDAQMKLRGCAHPDPSDVSIVLVTVDRFGDPFEPRWAYADPETGPCLVGVLEDLKFPKGPGWVEMRLRFR